MINDSQIDEDGFRRRSAALLRGAANDLKRNDAAADHDLGLAPGQFEKLASGAQKIPDSVRRAAAAAWPLNERDLTPIRNDCPEGVLLFSLAHSMKSARVIQRGGIDYYEYRDTAASRLSSFRPEWIRMLSVVNDDRPDNPGVHWNNGHLLYQFTYFVGPVNYYYRWGNDEHVLRMRTGDSIWGFPFSPHTFTARTSSEPAYILALTYGAELCGDTQHELAALGPETAEQFALDTGARARQAALLAARMDAGILSVAEVAKRSGLDADLIEEVLVADRALTGDERTRLADALGVCERDILPVEISDAGSINLCRAERALQWEYPSTGDAADYLVTQLAGNLLHPETRAIEIRPLRQDASATSLVTHQHQYLYNVGPNPVYLSWEHNGKRSSATLDSGASAYVMPFVSIAYTADNPPSAVLLTLRIGGNVNTEARVALGAMHPGGLKRLLREELQWYNP